ncbi:hypothetical protein [Comamonas sp.]|uniref:hypothetical protein n=1 Tax=Comamonas sp. TaxID=34028 RepID=UPI0012D13051|nr:hypothetical protein [Comamonas sp.]MPS92933.1 hypothetical protein [Comamonas sp.]
MALVLRVQRSGNQWSSKLDVEKIALSSFKFQGYDNFSNIPDYKPQRFLRCISCGFDEFSELHVNSLVCVQCDQKISITPLSMQESKE